MTSYRLELIWVQLCLLWYGLSFLVSLFLTEKKITTSVQAWEAHSRDTNTRNFVFNNLSYTETEGPITVQVAWKNNRVCRNVIFCSRHPELLEAAANQTTIHSKLPGDLMPLLDALC
jgi:hypothetical protein